MSWVAHSPTRLGRHELPVLLCIATLSGGLWAFIQLADEVTERDTRQFDERLLVALRNPADLSDPLGPQWVEDMGRDFTALGGVGVLTLITLVTVGYLLLSRKLRAAGFTVVAIGGGWFISRLLKSSFERPRPDLVPTEVAVYTSSFPSGHAMMSAVTYLTLAAMLSRMENRWRLKGYFLAVAVLVTLLVGVSRVYLGVHWPTDVLAGWSVGAAWAAACWLAARALQRRGGMERP